MQLISNFLQTTVSNQEKERLEKCYVVCSVGKFSRLPLPVHNATPNLTEAMMKIKI